MDPHPFVQFSPKILFQPQPTSRDPSPLHPHVGRPSTSQQPNSPSPDQILHCFSLFRRLPSCSNHPTWVMGGGALLKGRQIHGYIVRNEIKVTIFTATALIDFYGKRGCPEKSLKLFAQMDVKMVCTWNAVISSLACNGMENAALDMFDKMVKGGLLPNEVTFVAVFTACAHGNLLDFGMKFYEHMVIDLGILPTMEHYGCMVHLLGKGGLLREAAVLIGSMPFEADCSVLGALLGACKIHGAIELGTKVWQKLLKIHPFQYGQYVALSSMDAEFNDWKNAADLRKIMEGSRVEKIPAYSLMDSSM